MKMETVSDFEGSVPSNRIKFKFSSNNAKLFGILSDGIYKDKMLAVIREISCNAFDAHIVANNPNPFTVQVPTAMTPTFMIEDQGTGLPPEKIGDIFWTYGDSTKTDDNRQIGALGLGSKSPFAYTKSSFIVKNRWKGVEYIYMCFINEEGTPDGSLVSEDPTEKPDGVTVEIAVRSSDVWAFQQRIARFFRFWPQKPNFIGYPITFADVKKTFEGPTWFHEAGSTNTTALAVMGNVPYPIDIDAIPNASDELKFLANNTFVLTFPLGDLAFQVSREELGYEDKTIKSLEAMAKRIVIDIATTIKDELEGKSNTAYELWANFKTMVQNVQLKDMELIGGALFKDDEVFTAKDGANFTAEELSKTHVNLIIPGRAPFMVSQLIKYRTSNSLRNEGKVLMTLDEEIAGKTQTRKVNVPWYTDGVVGRITIAGNQPADYLWQGYAPKETSYEFPIMAQGTLDIRSTSSNKSVGTILRILINDLGPLGREHARHMGKKCGEFYKNKLFYLIDPAKNVLPADTLKAVESMVKDTMIEGVEIVYLSAAADFEKAPARPSNIGQTVTGPKPRGHVEVREVKMGDRKYSAYINVDPSVFEGYYFYPGKVEMAYFRDKLPYIVSKLEATKLFKLDALPFIVRNEADIELMKKRGAKLTHINDIIPDSIRVTLQKEIDDHAIASAAITNDSLYGLYQLLSCLSTEVTNFQPSRFKDLITKFKTATEAVNSGTRHNITSAASALGLSAAPVKNKDSIMNRVAAIYPMLSVITDSRNVKMIKNYIQLVDDHEAMTMAITKRIAEEELAKESIQPVANDDLIEMATNNA